MLSTSQEPVKTPGNQDEQGEKHALGRSGEVGLRAGRGRAGTGYWRMEKRNRGKCKRKGCPDGSPEVEPEVSRSPAAPGFQTRIPKETGVGVGVGLTIAEKL